MTAPDRLSIDINPSDRGVVVQLRGTASMEHCDRLNALLMKAAESEPRLLVIDLDQLDFICSMGLGAIVAAYLRARRYDGQIALGAPNEAIREMLDVTRLDTLIDIYDTPAQALEAVS